MSRAVEDGQCFFLALAMLCRRQADIYKQLHFEHIHCVAVFFFPWHSTVFQYLWYPPCSRFIRIYSSACNEEILDLRGCAYLIFTQLFLRIFNVNSTFPADFSYCINRYYTITLDFFLYLIELRRRRHTIEMEGASKREKS